MITLVESYDSPEGPHSWNACTFQIFSFEMSRTFFPQVDLECEPPGQEPVKQSERTKDFDCTLERNP